MSLTYNFLSIIEYYSINNLKLAGLSFINNFSYLETSYNLYDLKYGIPGGFIDAHPRGVNIDITKKQFRFESKKNSKDESNYLKISCENIYHRHKEFEFSGRIGSEFRIITNLAGIDIDHSKILGFDEGIIGLSLEHRDFQIGGYVFTPPTNSFSLSSFVYEEVSMGKLNLNFSIRYSFDFIKPKVDNPNSKIGHIRKRYFNNLSISTSLIYQLSDIVFIGANVSKSSIVPTIEELFSEGPHLAAYSYEIGNPDLNSESGIGSEFFVYHKFDKLNFNINFFYHNFSSFIIPRNSGEINYQTFFPIYKTYGVSALLYGFEGSLNWNFYYNLFLSHSVSFTEGIFRENSKPLPQIPPLKGITGIQYKVEKITFGINCEWAFRQNNVEAFEQPTPGYLVFNTFAQYLFYQ